LSLTTNALIPGPGSPCSCSTSFFSRAIQAILDVQICDSFLNK
jgi:hypothetical protein